MTDVSYSVEHCMTYESDCPPSISPSLIYPRSFSLLPTAAPSPSTSLRTEPYLSIPFHSIPFIQLYPLPSYFISFHQILRMKTSVGILPSTSSIAMVSYLLSRSVCRSYCISHAHVVLVILSATSPLHHDSKYSILNSGDLIQS